MMATYTFTITYLLTHPGNVLEAIVPSLSKFVVFVTTLTQRQGTWYNLVEIRFAC